MTSHYTHSLLGGAVAKDASGTPWFLCLQGRCYIATVQYYDDYGIWEAAPASRRARYEPSGRRKIEMEVDEVEGSVWGGQMLGSSRTSQPRKDEIYREFPQPLLFAAFSPRGHRDISMGGPGQISKLVGYRRTAESTGRCRCVQPLVDQRDHFPQMLSRADGE